MQFVMAASVVTAALMTGCATPPSSVQSNRAQDWNGQVRKAYVQVTFMSEWGQEFNGSLESRLGSIFADCGVTSKVVRRSTLDLQTEESRAADLRQFAADSVLTVGPTGGGLNQGSLVINRIFAAQLTVAPSRVVWKANFTVRRGGTAVETLAERGAAFAVELTNQMKTDRLLGSCALVPVPKSGVK